MTLKDVFMGCFKILVHYLPVGTEKNYEGPQSGWQSGRYSDPGPSEYGI